VRRTEADLSPRSRVSCLDVAICVWGGEDATSISRGLVAASSQERPLPEPPDIGCPVALRPRSSSGRILFFVGFTSASSGLSETRSAPVCPSPAGDSSGRAAERVYPPIVVAVA